MNDVKNATLRNNIIYECDKHGLQITENSTVTLKGTNKIYSNEKEWDFLWFFEIKATGFHKDIPKWCYGSLYL